MNTMIGQCPTVRREDYDQVTRNLEQKDLELIQSDAPLPEDACMKIRTARRMWLELQKFEQKPPTLETVSRESGSGSDH